MMPTVAAHTHEELTGIKSVQDYLRGRRFGVLGDRRLAQSVLCNVMRVIRPLILLILVLQLLLGGAVQAHMPDPQGHEAEAAHAADAGHHQLHSTHGEHHEAGECGLCGLCLAGAPVTADDAAPGHVAALAPDRYSGQPVARIDTLLRPPRHRA